MCWYSATHADKILQAEAGQRLGIRKVHGCSWAVRESDLHNARPTPVCMLDQTRVLIRYSEVQQVTLHTAPEAEVVFRMLTKPKRDVFVFDDGREVSLDSLPSNLIFDILEVPGKEDLSAVLKEDGVEEPVAVGISSKRDSLLERVLQFF
jgi:hypothetical protein